MPGAIAGGTDGEHDGHFHQDPHHGRQSGARLRTEQSDGGGHGELEEIAGADEGPGTRHGMLHLEEPHQSVGQRGVEVDLQGDGHGNQQDVEEAAGDIVGLESEDEDQGGEQRGDGDGREAGQEPLFEPLLSAAADEPPTKQGAGGQRDDDEHDDGVQQDAEGHGERGSAGDQELNQGHEGDEHDEIVDRDLDERVGGVAVGEMAPDEDHGGAGRGGQDDAAGDVLIGFGAGDEVREDQPEEEPGEQSHGEWFDHPIHEERDEQSGGLAAHVADGAEIHLHHHGSDHQPDEDGDGQVDLSAACELQAAQALDGGGQRLAKHYADGHAKAHPEGQIAFEKGNESSE